MPRRASAHDGESLAPEQVIAFRLARHHLDRRVPRGHLRNVLRDIIGVQAQVPRAAALALWARVDGITIDDVDAALYRTRMLI